jgi:LmbE family N-acetylglucosaminyl deacetylase
MAVAYVLAHFDDEYFAEPLIREQLRAGEDLWFFYVADYRTPALAERRHGESRRYLAHLGADPGRALHTGGGTGAQDGAVHRALAPAYAALAAAAVRAGPIRQVVTTAYEGGHMDHDCCAALASALAREHGAPLEQFSLYNGLGAPAPLFRAARPLPQNGPVRRVAVQGWARWMAGVRFFPSQARTWMGLWPMMYASLLAGGFGVQGLEPARLAERPHAGQLLYERMFGVAYAEVRAALDEFASCGPGPA